MAGGVGRILHFRAAKRWPAATIGLPEPPHRIPRRQRSSTSPSSGDRVDLGSEPEGRIAGMDDVEARELQVGERRAHRRCDRGRGGPLELEASLTASVGDEQVQLGLRVRGPEVTLIPVRSQVAHDLAEEESLPRGPDLRMAEQRTVRLDVE